MSNSTITLRKYQSESIQAGLSSDNGIIVLPTGAGKSVVIAGLVSELEGNTLILQPSREILESNHSRLLEYGYTNVGIYSASVGVKKIEKATYATIGSIINKLNEFSSFKNLIIDECHAVNSKGGQYQKLIKTLKPDKLIGLTATPYRNHTNSYGTNARILTRTRPKLFKEIIYFLNPRDLISQNFLVEPEFVKFEDVSKSMLRYNSNRSELSEPSINKFYDANSIEDKITSIGNDISKGFNHCLIFVNAVDQALSLSESLTRKGHIASNVHAKTPKAERSVRINDFLSGRIKFMVNVGTLTTGFDFPALDCIIDARPTRSGALHYQKIGRIMRPFKNKKSVVFDIAGNNESLGSPSNYTIIKNGKLHEVISERGRLTTKIIGENDCLRFGKHKDQDIKKVPEGYLTWCKENLDNSNAISLVTCELKRRKLFEAELMETTLSERMANFEMV